MGCYGVDRYQAGKDSIYILSIILSTYQLVNNFLLKSGIITSCGCLLPVGILALLGRAIQTAAKVEL